MYLYLWLNINLKFRTMKQIGRNVMCGLCTAVTAAAVLLFSCTQGPEPVGPQSGMTIRATTEVTRTALGADYSVVWNEGDSFLLMNDSGSSSMFGLTDGAGERSATFTGDWLDAGSDGMYYAAYPAAGAVYDSGSVAMEIPTGQTYVAGTFASDCNPMVASGSDPESGLAFRNVFGLLELRITGSTVLSKLMLTSNTDLSEQALNLSGRMYFGADGSFVGYAKTEQTARSVTVTGIDTQLSDTPLSVYVAVPPAEYDALTVRLFDKEGGYVERTLASPITVARNTVLPVEGLVFDGAEKTGAVIMTIDQKNYSPYRMLVNFVMAEGCASFIPGYVEKAVLEQWFADNAGHTMEEFILANQAYQEQFGDIPGEFSVEPETEYVVYAQPYDADHRPLETVTETYRTKALVRSGERMTGSYAWLAADLLELRFEFSSPAVERYWLAVYAGADYENVFKEEYEDELRGVLSVGSVFPATEAVQTLAVPSGKADRYVVLAVPESADGIGELCTFTVEAQRSAAALSSLDVDASDRSFVVRFVNDGSAYVRFGAFQGGVSDEDLKATLAGGGNLLEFESESASVEREFVNFKPLTDYTVAALAFDADGVAGGFYRADFTTLDLIPGEDSEAYRKYIGTWALTFYTDAAKANGPYWQPVTVREEVVGKSYLVSGLMNSMSGTVVTDDAVRAYFTDGRIEFAGGTPVAAAGANVTFEPFTSGMYIGNGYSLYGTWNADGVSFDESWDSYDVIGYAFWNNDAGAQVDILFFYPSLLPQTSGGMASTESFVPQPPVSPGWK